MSMRRPRKMAASLLGEVVADDADEIDVREETRRHRKIRGRAAQRAVHLAERRFQSIERDRTNNEK